MQLIASTAVVFTAHSSQPPMMINVTSVEALVRQDGKIKIEEKDDKIGYLNSI